MRSILLLGATFALLIFYLERSPHPGQTNGTRATFNKIIRTANTVANTKITVITPAETPVQPDIIPLNLNIPLFKAFQPHFFNRTAPILQIPTITRNNAISYQAELVFDAEKGENITGGKIHIKIPFG